MTLISIAVVYNTLQIPEKQTLTKTIGAYTSIAEYDYTALLSPSTIYGNKSTLKPGEELLYTKLIKQIDLTLTYTFNTTFPTTTSIKYAITQTLKTDAWQHRIFSTPPQDTEQKTIQIILPPYNRTQLEELKKDINDETGTLNYPYILEITPTFTITTTTPQGQLQETFEPTLRISTNQTREGYITTIDDLYQTETHTLTQTQTTINQNVLNQHYASYALIALSLLGLPITSILYIRNRKTYLLIETEKLIEAHKDLIVQATDNNIADQLNITINLKTMEELAKTAEVLAKPIIHIINEEQKQVFYVVDNNTKYRYEKNHD